MKGGGKERQMLKIDFREKDESLEKGRGEKN